MLSSILTGLLAATCLTTARVIDRNGPQNEARQSAAEYEGYMFAYFTGNTVDGEKIRFAASNGNNALDWAELNGGQPVLTSTKGTTGLRDPFIIRSADGATFYILATDLSIGSGTSWDAAVRTGSRYLEIWESNDLVTWSEQRHVLVSPPTAGMTWAPEAYFDTSLNAYVVYWASALYAEDDPDHTGSSYNRMMYATTTDFVTFSEAKVWQDSGASRIDSTVIKVDNTYYRFTKDEGAVTGCTDIIQESSPDLLAQVNGWTTIASCIGKNAGLQAVEGPTAFKSNPGDVNGDVFYLFVDEYGGRGYVPLQTANIAQPNWQVPSTYNLPKSPRHGTVLPITATELQRLTSTTLKKREDKLFPGYNADPNIAVFGCEYYLYPTTDGYAGWGGYEFYVWKSSDLVNWQKSAQPILTLQGEDGNVPWATGNAWAPTITERDGKYYFYFSGQNPTYNAKTIGVAVADSPEGPFTAEPEAFITNTEAVATGQAIDSDAFVDPNTGKYWLYWGNGNPLVAELADDMISLKPDTTQKITGLTDFREGSFMVYRAPYYHMTYSIDDTGSENYRVGYATSDSPTGPFTYQGVILQKDTSQGILATGHNSIINVPGTDDWYIAYHRFAIPDGDGTHREVTIDRITFDETTRLINTVAPTLNGPGAQSAC